MKQTEHKKIHLHIIFAIRLGCPVTERSIACQDRTI